jgi:hypothetical protein
VTFVVGVGGCLTKSRFALQGARTWEIYVLLLIQFC